MRHVLHIVHPTVHTCLTKDLQAACPSMAPARLHINALKGVSGLAPPLPGWPVSLGVAAVHEAVVRAHLAHAHARARIRPTQQRCSLLRPPQAVRLRAALRISGMRAQVYKGMH